MHETDLKQTVFSTSKGDVEVISLHRKEYLQPFENELADRELEPTRALKRIHDKANLKVLT